MKRYKYGLNSQVLTGGDIGELICVGAYGVNPGDTMQGQVLLQTLTESVQKVINNRTYVDVYAFYVPYRLLWDEWPAYISGQGGTLPALANENGTWPQFLVKQLANSIGGVGQATSFGRTAYNLIWNKFFRTPSVSEVALTNFATLKCPLRSSTLIQRMREDGDLDDQTIDVSGATITTQDIREAFAQDRFNKTRTLYGEKYTDYLAALGVEASWSILDEPEVIGVSRNRLKFNIIDSTAQPETKSSGEADFVGSAGGRWQGTQTLKLRKTFCPEHGLLLMYATVRMDLEQNNNKGVVEFLKSSVDQFYSPEYETERKEVWKPFANAGAEEDYYTTKYEDYRVGQNLCASATDYGRVGTWVDIPNNTNPTAEEILYPQYTAVNGLMNDQFTNIEVNYTAMHMLSRISPVRPAQASHGVA